MTNGTKAVRIEDWIEDPAPSHPDVKQEAALNLSPRATHAALIGILAGSRRVAELGAGFLAGEREDGSQVTYSDAVYLQALSDIRKIAVGLQAHCDTLLKGMGR